MQLSEIRTRLIDLYGNTLTSEIDFYNRIINDAYAKICASGEWWWLENTVVLRFDAPMVSGDFLGTIGTTTFKASVADDWPGSSYVSGWAYTGNYTYRLTGTAAASTFIIDAPFIETTTSYGCYLWNDVEALPSAFDHAIQMVPRNDPNYRPLRQVELSEIERHGINLEGAESEIAESYAVFHEGSANSVDQKIRIFPPPEETAEYIMRYIQAPSILSASTDAPLIPLKHHQTLVDLARLELSKVSGANPDEIAIWETEVQKGMARMVNDQLKRGNPLRVFGRQGRVGTLRLPFKLTNYTLGVDTE